MSTSQTKWLVVTTDAGRTAIRSTDGQGLKTKIVAVALGDGRYQVRDGTGAATELALQATSLAHERVRVPVYAGGSSTRGSMQILAEVPRASTAAEEFWVSEIAFIDENGVVLSIWSDLTETLGYRGSLNPWVLNLGWTWSDMPEDAVSVEVLNAPLSATLISLSQIRTQLHAMAEQSGVPYDPSNPNLLLDAIRQQVQTTVGSIDQSVRQPIAVSPAAGAAGVVLVPLLQGSTFFSPDGFAHTGSQFVVTRTDGTLVHDSGEIAAAVSHQVPNGKLLTTTAYDWKVRYKGTLGSTHEWSDWSALSRFTTAASIVQAPTMLTPVSGTTAVGPQPTITSSAFQVIAGADSHAATRWQIATDEAFTALVWDSGNVNSLTQVVVPAGALTTDTVYYVRARHVGTTLGASAWAVPVWFRTRASFVYVSPPTVVTPANGATGVSLVPAMTFSSYAMVGGADTHDRTQVQIRAATGTWGAPLYDSGELAAATSHTVPLASALPQQTACVARVRYRGAGTGWSAWSGEVGFTTGQVTGTALWDVPGNYNWTVPAGVYEVEASVGGAGGPGRGYASARWKPGCGGGWTKKRIAVTPGQVIAITVGRGADVHGQIGGTSSFGSYCSATGGAHFDDVQGPGQGIGGDVNYAGTLGTPGTPSPSDPNEFFDAGASGKSGGYGREAYASTTSPSASTRPGRGDGGISWNTGSDTPGAHGFVVVRY